MNNIRLEKHAPATPTNLGSGWVILAAVVCLFSPEFLSAGELSVVPQPVRQQVTSGSFLLTPGCRIEADSAFAPEAGLLKEQLARATGLTLATGSSGKAPAGIIRLVRETDTNVSPEGYTLVVTPERITIRAGAAAGVFYGGQTLLQLLPPESFSSKVFPGVKWQIPGVNITDQPRFQWRGLMLDCSRTFQSVAYLHQTIDRMAVYKLNVLHLHLTDDQGWRLEIKAFPELTRKGAFFPARYGEPPSHQGFYTQAQMRELVNYAAARHITIVPEIEMPGHSLDALAGYPELSCTGGPFEIFPFFKGPSVNVNVFCAGNDATFEFIDQVLAEVADIFPGSYIHIGGDEVPKTAWHACAKCQARMKAEGLKDEEELQSYFIRRVEKLVEKHGKRLIGWDEVLQGGLAPNAMVMSWRGVKGGTAAARAGHEVVMSPTGYCYFDYAQSTTDSARVFSFDPVAGIPPGAARHVLGLQANFWSHIDREPERVDRQLYPRLLAIAERGWSPDNRGEWPDYLRRARAQLPRLARLGIHYHPSDLADKVGEWDPGSFAAGATNLEFDVPPQLAAAGELLAMPVYARGSHGVYLHAAELLQDRQVVAGDRHEGFTGTRPTNEIYILRLPDKPSGGGYRLRLSLEPAGGTNTWGKVLLAPSTARLSRESLPVGKSTGQ